MLRLYFGPHSWSDPVGWNMIALPLLLLYLTFCNGSQVFETECSALIGTNIHSYYYRGNCYVWDGRTTLDWYSHTCRHLGGVPGYLAILPGAQFVQKMFAEFTGLWPQEAGWIGLKRNSTTGGGTSNAYYYWQGNGGQEWHAPPHATPWRSGEPDNSGMTCGHLWSNWVDAINQYDCTVSKAKLCQYRDPRLDFKEVAEGVRGAVADTLIETTVAHPLKCTEACMNNVVCQSYSYSKNTSLCAIHMLPADELPTEAMGDGKIFDLV